MAFRTAKGGGQRRACGLSLKIRFYKTLNFRALFCTQILGSQPSPPPSPFKHSPRPAPRTRTPTYAGPRGVRAHVAFQLFWCPEVCWEQRLAGLQRGQWCRPQMQISQMQGPALGQRLDFVGRGACKGTGPLWGLAGRVPLGPGDRDGLELGSSSTLLPSSSTLLPSSSTLLPSSSTLLPSCPQGRRAPPTRFSCGRSMTPWPWIW